MGSLLNWLIDNESLYFLQNSDQIEDHKAFLEPEHQQLLSEDDHFSGEGSKLKMDGPTSSCDPQDLFVSKKLINSIYQNRTKSVTLEKLHMNGIKLSVVKEI